MVKHHLAFAKHDAGCHLLGSAAHVYADTFSHHGFSGIGSKRNKIDNNSFTFDSQLDPDIKDYITEKAAKFFELNGKGGGIIANIKSWIAETVSAALGHGAVATYPDRPYLKWGFAYEYPRRKLVNRDNPADFLEGCRALHEMFEEFGKINPNYSDNNGVNFSAIKNQIMGIIQFQGKMEKRINKWKELAETIKNCDGKTLMILPDTTIHYLIYESKKILISGTHDYASICLNRLLMQRKLNDFEHITNIVDWHNSDLMLVGEFYQNDVLNEYLKENYKPIAHIAEYVLWCRINKKAVSDEIGYQCEYIPSNP